MEKMNPKSLMGFFSCIIYDNQMSDLEKAFLYTQKDDIDSFSLLVPEIVKLNATVSIFSNISTKKFIFN